MKLKKFEIKDNFPLMITLCGKSILKKDKNDKVVVDYLLDRQEDSCMITNISCAALKPSINKKKLVDVLRYFFTVVCDSSLSPQFMWETDDCDYISLLVDYDIKEEKQFEDILNKITKFFPKLKQSKNFIEKIPKGKNLLDVVSQIEVAYPET